MFDYEPGGPVTDAYKAWKYHWFPKVWPPQDEGDSEESHWWPVPTESIDELVCITEEDGRFWEEVTVIAPRWDKTDFVCPSHVECPYDGFDVPKIDNEDGWLNCVPCDVWTVIHGNSIGKDVNDIYYYGMEERHDAFNFDYARRRCRGPKDDLYSFYTTSMEDCSYLLARPQTPSPLFRTLAISELFLHIMSFLQSSLPKSPEVTPPVFHEPYYGYGDIYFGLVRDSGWMLPTTPADWEGWMAAGNPNPIRVGQWDWKTYLETFVWNGSIDTAVENRSMGEYGRPCALTRPDWFEWEVPPPKAEEDETDWSLTLSTLFDFE
ncbi:hypothetical protein BC834DRAFT_846770 [Gloeopeniophorella convolvens]|nr:hypothetical protein BC834DRAFT_846770 [Gloeopeniophorella convolvens]